MKISGILAYSEMEVLAEICTKLLTLASIGVEVDTPNGVFSICCQFFRRMTLIFCRANGALLAQRLAKKFDRVRSSRGAMTSEVEQTTDFSPKSRFEPRKLLPLTGMETLSVI